MVDYGPRTQDVQAFIDSLRDLSEEDWNAKELADRRGEVNLHEGATTQLDCLAAANMTGLSWMQGLAQIATRDTVKSLHWSDRDLEESLASVAHYAVGAIVVMNSVPFQKIVPTFYPFRDTAVKLPMM